jgi:hypothetical protein
MRWTAVRLDLVLPTQCGQIIYRTRIVKNVNGMVRRRHSPSRNHAFTRWDINPREREAQHGHLNKRRPQFTLQGEYNYGNGNDSIEQIRVGIQTQD